MTEESTGEAAKKRSLKTKAAGWLYRLVSKPGWARKTFLIVSVALFFILLAILCGGTDYRTDPSALVPRSASFYAETRDLELLLKNVSSWPLWNSQRRELGEGGLQDELAGSIGDMVPGLGTTLPLTWTSGVKNPAALAVSSSEDKSWALYFHVADPVAIVADIKRERRLKIAPVRLQENDREGIYQLTNAEGAGSLIIAAVGPWLIVSSDTVLPAFAMESVRRTSLSLSRSDILPDWGRNMSVRGVADPVYVTGRPDLAGMMAKIGGWLDSNSRLSFTSRLDSEGGIDSSLRVTVLSSRVKGSGVWPLVKFILFLVWLACIAAILICLASVIGWTGWLKAAAAKAGVKPVDAPAAVELSEAFKEDAGVGGTEKEKSDEPVSATGAEPAASRDEPAESAAPSPTDADEDHDEVIPAVEPEPEPAPAAPESVDAGASPEEGDASR